MSAFEKILIVEDEPLLALSLKRTLEELDFQVTGVANSYENALKQIEKEIPELVFMDVRIKGEKDGIDAAELIVRDYDLPIIFLTAYSDNEILQRAKSCEPFGYLIKPVERRELHSVLEMALYKSKMEKERKRLLKELQEAREEIENLRDIIPICTHCKKIRDDEGYWNNVEEYFSRHTGVKFSHGICPDCAKTHYPELYEDAMKKKNQDKRGKMTKNGEDSQK